MSWLSPLKPLVVVAALGGVAYVVYIFTTSVPPEPPKGATAMEDIPSVDEMTGGVPAMELPPMDIATDATPGGAAPAWTPPPAGSAANTPQTLPSFETPLTPEVPGIGAPNVEIPGAAIDSAAPVSAADQFAPPSDFAPPSGFTANPAESFEQTPAATAAASSFAASMDEAKQLLNQNQLTQALRQLSTLHKDPNLTPAERATLNDLLDQVAGTVIYSREHRLLGAHSVLPNESLETIAAKYQVPAGLLAKINGIADSAALKPGDELKVVQGPFGADIDLASGVLTLTLDGNYAGRFGISAAQGAAAAAGNYVVEAKPGFHNLQLTPQAVGAPGAGSVLIGANNPLVALKLSPRDAEDVSSILSEGSTVVIRK
ncbi:MAG: LysM peptidoglycan-binding domain-containing protein [Pirellulales bacterium]|nr:LysM peptidoglycan-binding domain-containing protein [Pirellulales bacterium]